MEHGHLTLQSRVTEDARTGDVKDGQVDVVVTTERLVAGQWIKTTRRSRQPL